MMNKDQWQIFVERTLSPEFQKKTSPESTIISWSKVWIKGHSKGNGQPSTQDVGDVSEKMKEIEECTPKLQNTTNIKDDALSRVLGQESRGRVRGMGFGVKPSQVGAQIQQNATVKQLQNTVQKLQEDVAMLFEMNQHNQAEQAASGGVMSGIGNEVNSGDNNNGAK